MLADNDANLSYMSENKIKTCTPDVMLDDIKTLDIGNSVIKVFHTPGHSRGGVSFLLEDNLFSGDLLFKESIGRFDFDHSNLWTELKSLRFLMENFDDSVKVYPGHGESTTIGYERENNPYIINHVLR